MNKDFSILNGYNVKDAYTRYNNIVNATHEGIVGDGVTDDTEALQTLIDKLYNENGGTIILEKNNYLISTINLKSKVNILGNFKGNTCIHQTVTATNHMIIINEYCTNNEIAYLSLIGNQENIVNNDGINIVQVDLSQVSNNHNALDNANTNHSLTEQVSYKYLNIHDCFIGYMTNNGITINANNYAINVNNCYFSFNKNNGIYDTSTDNFYSNLQVERNGAYGIYINSSNNKYVNIKTIWNGNRNPNAYGLYVKGSRNNLTNLEAQDNFCNGIGTQGYQNTFNSCVSDCNGYDYQEYVKGTIVGLDNSYLWFINGALNSFYNCVASQYRSTDNPIANYSVFLNNYQKNNDFNGIKVRPKSARNNNVYYNPIYEPINISLGNNDTITENGLTIGNSSSPSHIMKKLNITNYLYLMYELTYQSVGEYPRLLGLECTDTSSEPRPLLFMWNGTTFVIYLQGRGVTFNLPSSFEFTSGLTYRFTINMFSLNDSTSVKLGVSYVDSNGTTQVFPIDSMEQNFNLIYNFSQINNIYLNNASSQSARHGSIIKKLLISNKEIDMQYQDIRLDMKKAYKDGDLFIDFTNFNNAQNYPLIPNVTTTYIDTWNGGYKIEGEKVIINITCHFKENAFNGQAGNRINPINQFPRELFETNISVVDTTNSNIIQGFLSQGRLSLVCTNSFYSFNNSTIKIYGEYYRKN